MKPIEKNISVIDEKGNEYEATYPKRAKCLVKKGRARFVNDNTICLACPPDIWEDTEMSDNNIKTTETVNAAAADKAGKPETVSLSSSEPKLTVGYILERIEKIQQDNEHIYKALEALTGVDSGQVPGDVAGEGKANGIADTVKSRETTNQKLIAFYEKLYDDIKPVKSTKETVLGMISQVASRNDADPAQIANLAEMVSTMLDDIRHMD